MAADVTCADVRAAIRGGTLTAEVRAHGAGCPPCAELLADDAELGRLLTEPDPAPMADGFADQVLARIRQERNPAPRLPTGARVALMWAAVFVPALVIVLWRPRPDLADYPVTRMVAVLATWVAAGAVAARVVLRPVHRMTVAAPGLWVGLAFSAPLAVGLLPPLENGLAEPPWLHGVIHCLSRGAAVAVLVLGALRLSDRRSRPGPLWWAGAGGLAAVAGGLMLQLSCSHTGVIHLIAGHGSIGLLVGGAAALVAEVVVRSGPRSS